MSRQALIDRGAQSVLLAPEVREGLERVATSLGLRYPDGKAAGRPSPALAIRALLEMHGEDEAASLRRWRVLRDDFVARYERMRREARRARHG